MPTLLNGWQAVSLDTGDSVTVFAVQGDARVTTTFATGGSSEFTLFGSRDGAWSRTIQGPATVNIQCLRGPVEYTTSIRNEVTSSTGINAPLPDNTDTIAQWSNSTGTALVRPDGTVTSNLVDGFAFQRQLNQQRVFERFNALADWTYSAATPATTNITEATSTGPLANTALRFQATAIAGQNATVTKNITFNLNTLDGFWLISDVQFRQTATQIGLTLFTSALADLGSGSGRWTYANPVSASAVSLQPFWVPKAGWTVLDGTPSWAADQLSWRARLDSNAAEPRDWSLVGAFTGGARPTIIITLDDGWTTSFTIGHAEARRRGIPLTHYVIASLLDSANYITTAQLQQMRAAGDYVGLHGALRWDQSPARIATDAQALQAIGVDIQHASYPEGQIGAGYTWRNTKAALVAAGVKTARLAGGNSPTLRFVGDPYALTSYPLNNTFSLANAQAAVDTAIASNGTVIFYGHQFGATADSLTWVTSDWIALLNYIYQRRLTGQIDVTTIDRWWSGVPY